MTNALHGADIIVSGVSSFGIPWFIESVAPKLTAGVPLLSVTKGLEINTEGDLDHFLNSINRGLPQHLKHQIPLSAIGGPCISHELAARRQTSVIFCGENPDVTAFLRTVFSTSYYHILISEDVIGVEVSAALKNGYALGINFPMGMFDKFGADGFAQWYNPQAALFAQSIKEINQFIEMLGGKDSEALVLAGVGDLFVTSFGGRSARMGRTLGKGIKFNEALKSFTGETLEAVEIIKVVGTAITKLESRGVIQTEDYPLMHHLYQIITENGELNIPFGSFFNLK
jgi:glycerol-3-phosphate dehydrogenase (NAD(P)+)